MERVQNMNMKKLLIILSLALMGCAKEDVECWEVTNSTFYFDSQTRVTVTKVTATKNGEVKKRTFINPKESYAKGDLICGYF